MERIICTIENQRDKLITSIDDVKDELLDLEAKKMELELLLEGYRHQVASCIEAVKYLKDIFLTEGGGE